MENLLVEARQGQIVDHPPLRWFIANTGDWVSEEQTLVGFVAAAQECQDQLHSYGICLELADFNPETQRWEGCLFSTEVAEMLQELHDERQFPYLFEAAPSVAELDWLERKAAGETTRAAHPLRAYFTQASVEALEKLGMAGPM